MLNLCSSPKEKLLAHATARYRACNWTFSSYLVLLFWSPEAHAKATVPDDARHGDTGYVGVLSVSGKRPDHFMVRSTASFVDKLRAEKTRLRYDNEPAMRKVAEKIAASRHPRSTTFWSQSIVQCTKVLVELREHITVYKLPPRALRTDIRARTGKDFVPGHAPFQWMLGHAAWAHNRFQPQSHRSGTSGQIRTGTCNKSPLLPFMLACMIRVPIDPPVLRKILDVQWMQRIWIGRLDESDGHVVLTPHGTVTGRTVRRLAGNLRVQHDLVGKLKGRVQDPALSQAELLKVLPASVPIKARG